MPAPPAIPTTVPFGRTARRLGWAHVPPAVRAEVERRVGSPVVADATVTAGFTPGVATVLTFADGSRLFVKAAAAAAQRAFAAAYREEGRKLRALDGLVPAPRLRWSLDDAWVVLGIEHVPHRHPVRPWADDELDRCLAVLAEVAATRLPDGPRLEPLADEVAAWPGHAAALRDGRPDLADRPVLEELAALAARLPAVATGDALVHGDVRDDNLLLADDGRVLLCDWNWPSRGPAWVDPLVTLVGPAGDGVDVEAVVARTPALAGADPEELDVFLAALAAYFLVSGDLPVPPSSPWIRAFQRWQGEAVLRWLSQRRGWDVPGLTDLGGVARRW